MKFTVLIFFVFEVVIAAKAKYGSFNLKVEKFELCKGPKQKECCNTTVNIVSDTVIDVDVFVKEDVSPIKGKVVTSSINKDDTVRLQINKPCENLFLRPVMQKVYNITSKCVILKGRYKFHIDVQDTLRSYYGGMHLYGTRIFKSILYGKDSNFLCTYIEMKLSPNT